MRFAILEKLLGKARDPQFIDPLAEALMKGNQDGVQLAEFQGSLCHEVCQECY